MSRGGGTEEARSAELAKIFSYPTSVSGITVLFSKILFYNITKVKRAL